MESVTETCVRAKDVEISWANVSSPELGKLCSTYRDGKSPSDTQDHRAFLNLQRDCIQINPLLILKYNKLKIHLT